MIGAIEIDLVDIGGGAIEIQVTAARIRFGAAGQIVERHEQAVEIFRVGFDEGGQFQSLSLDREFQPADASHFPLRARGGGHLQHHPIVVR